ncbi:beta-glucoside-specific PTS transporter subunit IIABC [Enterococcus raffinosus]|uniref:beta-glucoside-specific PTS transporter subunit IIABC n=1 Tax=Enterococcus raffinosus TaxID=71452 RepID=UPI0028FD3011|nr:beta-glucoside-specific PTS transporter subunit IIABC [Enterococcus raffinosus]
MNYTELAKKIVNELGGSNNIENALHCVTRLRFNLKEDSKANIKAIEQLEGVIGVQLKNGQYQVIIGQNVGKVFEEIKPLLNESSGSPSQSKKKFSLDLILDVLSGIFSPILPALVAGGMLKGIIALMSSLGAFSEGSGTLEMFNLIADVPFYFLPVLLALSSAKKFKVNSYLAVTVAGALLYPSFVNAFEADKNPFSFFGLSVPIFNYANSVFPIILGVGLLSIIYTFIDKFVPEILKMVVVPVLSLIITIPLTFLFLAPLGAYGGIGLANGIVWLFSTLGPIAGFLLGFFMPLIVIAGMHQSTSPIQIQNIASLGYDYLLPISFCHNMAESGAAFGAALRMKNKEMRAAAFSTSFSAFRGISEPALFTVNVVNRTPLIGAMVGSGIGGALTTILSVKCFAFVMPGITSLPIYANPDGTLTNILLMGLSIVAAFASACVVTFVLGLKKSKSQTEEDKSPVALEETVISPVKGKTIPLSEVKDDVFASGDMGSGFSVAPEDNNIYAPVSGTVEVFMDESKHAIGIRTKNENEILVHVGIDTVELHGKYFTSFVKQGDIVKQGDKILQVDFDKVVENGYDPTVIVVCTNAKKDVEVNIAKSPHMVVS